MKKFLQENAGIIAIIAFTSLIIAIISFSLFWAAREVQHETLQRVDRIVDISSLPGKNHQISDRSRKEINVLLSNNPRILGGWVTKLNYEKTENPIIYYFVKDEIIQKVMDTYAEKQASGRGNSSEELNADSAQSLRNSEEAKTGLIKCGPLSSTNIIKLAPGIQNNAKGVCRATIPPFDENVSLAVVVVLSIDANSNSAEIQEIRRMMLQLQIDIFNRDFQGRETWAHP